MRKLGIACKNLMVEKSNLELYQEFSSKELSNNLSVTGLSFSENWGRWSDGSEVKFMVFNLPVNDYIVKFDTFAFATRGVPLQQADVCINDEFFRTIEYNESGQATSSTSFYISKQTIEKNKDKLTIVFKIKNPAAPADYGFNGDTRKLGIAFKNLTVEKSNNIKTDFI